MPESEPTSNLSPGQRVGQGRYELQRLLGRGGMGEVWLARDHELNEEAALKFLPGILSADLEALADLRQETQKSRRLTHPNIIRIHDFCRFEGERPFITMEYIEGTTLSDLKAAQPQRLLSWEFLRPLVKQLCDALDYAHNEKVIHRDLKPANMMLDSKGRLKLADFGIAASASDSVSRVSRHVGSSGTPVYMSPQQMTSQPPRATDDIYALGATLYELLSSKPPFYTGDIFRQVQETPPTPLEQRLADLEKQNHVPPDAGALIMACLAKDPQQRPQSAGAVAEWIGLNIGTEGKSSSLLGQVFAPAANTTGTPAVPHEKPVAANRTGLWLGLGIAAVILVCAGAFVLRPRTAANAPTTGSGSSTPNAAESPKPTATAPSPASLASTTDTSEFQPLFNGRDLSGWSGDPRFWSVKDGVIVGATTPNAIPPGNTYLIWTNNPWSDFELRFSLKLVKAESGSGIQYRGRTTSTWSIHGYQLDNFPRADSKMTSGAVSYEAPGGSGRQGFANLVKPGERVTCNTGGQKSVTGTTGKSEAEIRALLKDGDWNEFTVIAQGGHITHYINGSLTAELFDNDTSLRFMSGLIGLKLRNNQGRPMHVEFKDIRLKPLELQATSTATTPAKSGGYITLFDGTSVSAWRGKDSTAFPLSCWKVEGGALKTIPTSKEKIDLVTRERFGDFDLEFEWAIGRDANSGVFYRMPTPGENTTVAPEMNLQDDQGKESKGILSTASGSLFGLVGPPALPRLKPFGQFNTGRIVARGNHVEHWINGQKQIEYEWGSPQLLAAIRNYPRFAASSTFMKSKEGYISLQFRAGEAAFRNIRIRRLD